MKTASAARLALLLFLGQSTASAQSGKAHSALALVGGTLIDVSDSGHGARDIPNAVVVLRAGRIEAAGPADLVKVPGDAKRIDCRSGYILPGLVDGFAGLNSQAQANAWLYMGVTTIVGVNDERRGRLMLDAHPSPHVYLMDVAGSIDDASLLIDLPQWRSKLKSSDEVVELSEMETKAQLAALARLGARVIYVPHDFTADRVKFIISESHQLGLSTYGVFAATSYSEALADRVDVLVHMTRYALGLIPPRLQQPLVKDPEGTAAHEAADAYLMHLDLADPSVTAYGRAIKASHAALLPTLSLSYLWLPDHRNLWKEPAASILDPKGLHLPPDPTSGEATEENREREIPRQARSWAINRAIRASHPLYLAGSGASAFGTMPGISTHTELELLVRSGLTPREALAAATDNYSERLGWHELGRVEAGRRADLLVLDADPTVDISNTRRIRSVILGGAVLDRDALLRSPSRAR